MDNKLLVAEYWHAMKHLPLSLMSYTHVYEQLIKIIETMCRFGLQAIDSSYAKVSVRSAAIRKKRKEKENKE
jgi:hypothetical protein